MRIGIDLGGTKIEGIVLRNDGEIIHKLRVPTRGDYYEIILDDLTALIQSLQARFKDRLSVGIGTPGCLSNNGEMKNVLSQYALKFMAGLLHQELPLRFNP